MRKVKIMLTSIALLAGIGGALAFKANAVRSFRFCIKSQVNGAGVTTCTVTKIGKINTTVSLTYATIFPAGVISCTLANGGEGIHCGPISFTTVEE